jgi:hypothetical protein
LSQNDETLNRSGKDAATGFTATISQSLRISETSTRALQSFHRNELPVDAALRLEQQLLQVQIFYKIWNIELLLAGTAQVIYRLIMRGVMAR